jgi:spore coat polysaccharide biosynthesis predicted glycosyltransferase SpsG
VFRSDASKVIGSGHILRSIGLIEELLSQKYKVVFVGDVCELPWVEEKIKSTGFTETFTSEKEYEPSAENDILILDSYNIEIDSPFISLDKWRSVIVIFDSYTPNYNANLKIHPGIRESWNLNTNSKTISGPNFIPIRKSISKIPKHAKNKELIITVVGGGVDYSEFVPEMSWHLSKIPGNFRANFFTNDSNKIVSDRRFEIFPIGAQLDLVGNETHLAFSTASTTCLEFISRGCALGICCSTENQESYYQELSDLGLARQIGRFAGGNWVLDANEIENLVTSEETRKLLTDNAMGLIDLNGAKRIIDEIFKL